MIATICLVVLAIYTTLATVQALLVAGCDDSHPWQTFFWAFLLAPLLFAKGVWK